MKCDVSSCKFNKNNTCSNIDNLEIMDTGEGVICGTYEESIESKRSGYELSNYIDKKYGEILFVHLNTSKGLSNTEEINKDIIKYKSDNCKMVIFDLTLHSGTRSDSRYLIYNKGMIFNTINDKDLLSYLKSKTCERLMKNESLLDCSILISTQIKMIKKGIII